MSIHAHCREATSRHIWFDIYGIAYAWHMRIRALMFQTRRHDDRSVESKPATFHEGSFVSFFSGHSI